MSTNQKDDQALNVPGTKNNHASENAQPSQQVDLSALDHLLDGGETKAMAQYWASLTPQEFVAEEAKFMKELRETLLPFKDEIAMWVESEEYGYDWETDGPLEEFIMKERARREAIAKLDNTSKENSSSEEQ